MGQDRYAAGLRRFRSLTRAAFLGIAIATFSLPACGGGGDSADPIVVTSSAPLPTAAVAAAGGPAPVVIAAVQACREKDATKLRGLISAELTNAEINAMFERGTDVQLLSQSVPPSGGDVVAVDVRLRVMGEAGESVELRTWELAEIDGVWRLTDLPMCY